MKTLEEIEGLLEEIEKLHERVVRTIKAYDAIVSTGELSAAARRIEREYREVVEREKDKKLTDGAVRAGIWILGKALGSKEVPAAYPKEEYEVVEIAEKDGEFKVINLSEMAREEGTTTDFLILSYTLKGYRLMDINSFKKRIEELKAKASSNSRLS